MKEIINKYFGHDKTLYFLSSDAHQVIAGDTYLRYQWNSGRIQLWFGCSDYEEVPIKICYDSVGLEKIIKAMIY